MQRQLLGLLKYQKCLFGDVLVAVVDAPLVTHFSLSVSCLFYTHKVVEVVWRLIRLVLIRLPG